jgi:membrane fusion protein, copper/silver efflux system
MTRRVATAAICILAVLALAAGLFVSRTANRVPAGQASAANDRNAAEYSCPMHPFIVNKRPGNCPVCGMPLVRKVVGNPAAPQATADIDISPQQRTMAGIATVRVEKMPLTREINATGIVTIDQTRQTRVSAWVAGRLERLHVDAAGAAASKGKPLAEISSPDLVYAEEEYLLAWKAQRQFASSPQAGFTDSSEALYFAARERLRQLQFREREFAMLERVGKPTVRLQVLSPLSGVVIEKSVIEGGYVNVGDPLFTIADLSSVWVEADVFESDLALLRTGQQVEIAPISYPGRTYSGRVSLITPFLDPKTRTVKVRVVLPNPGSRLKPEMLVQAVIREPLGDCLAIPFSAVMDNGRRKVVWAEKAPGIFAAREVAVGARAGDMVQILSGLAAGEKVAASGGYLIDSESQLRYVPPGLGTGPAPDKK